LFFHPLLRLASFPLAAARLTTLPCAISMIAKTFIPEKGAQPFAIMKRLARAPSLEVTPASAGSFSPRSGRLHDPSHHRVGFPPERGGPEWENASRSRRLAIEAAIGL